MKKYYIHNEDIDLLKDLKNGFDLSDDALESMAMNITNEPARLHSLISNEDVVLINKEANAQGIIDYSIL